MAQLAHILIPQGTAPAKATVGSANASAAIPIGKGKKFSITAVDSNLSAVPFQVAYGDSDVAATAADDLFLPGKYTLASNGMWTHISIYNPTSGNITYYVAEICNS